MSASLLGAAMKAKLGSRTRKLVLIKLVDCCHEDGTHIYPALATVAEDAECSVSTARRTLREFCDVGLLRKVKDGGSGAHSTAHYEMDIDLLSLLRRKDTWPALEAAALHNPRPDSGDDEEPAHAMDAGQTAQPCENKGVTVEGFHGGRLPNGEIRVPSDGTQPLSIEPLEDSERESVRAQADMPASDASVNAPCAPAALPATLEDFRKRWPDIHLSSQKKVEAAWAALPFGMRRQAVDSIAAFLSDHGKKGRKYDIAASTYLEERRWTLMPVPAEGKGAVAPGGYDVFKAWSRDWWLHLLDRIRRGEPVKSMVTRADGDSQSSSSVPVAVMAAARAHFGELQPFLCSGPEIAAWRPWFAEYEARIPVFEGTFRVFLPGPVPPGGRVDDGDDEVKF